MDLKYSANIGFLWEHLSLPQRIVAAHKAGFDAVECHFPYDYPAAEIAAVLNDVGIPMVGINTLLGPKKSGLFGLAAVPGQEALAQEYIDQAIDYAVAIGASNINVVAGVNRYIDSEKTHDQNNILYTSERTFRENLSYACKKAGDAGKTIVIEPLNPRAVAGYHLQSVEQGVETIEAVGADNLKLMFDMFHTQIVQGDIAELLINNLNHIGHVQISAVHDRGEPDIGELNYPYLLGVLREHGYSGYIGAEYKPRGQSVEAGLSWLGSFRTRV